MYIIEFCGLPGTGKSTICKNMERKLREENVNVKNLQLIPLGFSWKERRINQLEMFLEADCRKILSSYKKIFGKEKDKEKRYWLLRIRQNILIAKQWKKKGLQVASFDEGCVQFITSLFHGNEITEKEIEFASIVFDLAYSEYDKILFDCKLDIGENVKRIRHRGRPGDRFLADTDEEINRRLEIKRKNLDKCISLYGVVNEIDMLDFQAASEETIGIAENIICKR